MAQSHTAHSGQDRVSVLTASLEGTRQRGRCYSLHPTHPPNGPGLWLHSYQKTSENVSCAHVRSAGQAQNALALVDGEEGEGS